MTSVSLADVLGAAQNPVRAMRSVPYSSPYNLPRLPPEYSNWRLEQAAWHSGTAVLNLSEHMVDLFVTGPGALQLFSDLAVNSFAGFAPGMAKQLVLVNEEGRCIGDGILTYLDESSFCFNGDAGVAGWVEFHIERGDYDLSLEIDPNSLVRQGFPKLYRYQVQGPTALEVVAKASGAPVPETKFFHLTDVEIAGCRVRAIRHGMVGQPGFELFGPWAEGERVRDALLLAGAALGIQLIGSKAHFTGNLESGWFGLPLPAIFIGESTRSFREWLPAAALGSMGGSFDSENIEDYYVTPYDLGYRRFVSDNHDFIGRDAVRRLADQPARQKVTLVWNDEDLGELFGSLFTPGELPPPQLLDLAPARYARYHYDAVRSAGQLVGVSTHAAYIAPIRQFLSLALVDPRVKLGDEVTVTWGDSLSLPRTQVEPHRQVPVRATVAVSPYSSFTREKYRL